MISRDINKAREATIDAHKKKLHTSEEKHKTSGGKYIKSIIYGGLDGIITTFRNWFLSGLEMLIVGGIAAASAYRIEALFSGLA